MNTCNAGPLSMMGVNMSSSLILQSQCDTLGLPQYPVRVSSVLTADIEMQKLNFLTAGEAAGVMAGYKERERERGGERGL